jgi:hypothetical protein
MIECLNFNPNEIKSYGIAPFQDLSTRHFEVLAIDLGFTAPYHKDLRRIAREFSEHALSSIGISTPTKKLDTPFYDEDALLEAWRNVFAQLEMIGYNEIICNWLIKLRFEEEIRIKVESLPWRDILLDWARTPANFPTLHLSQNIIQEIRILVMLDFIDWASMNHRFPYVKDDLEMDEWEEFTMDKVGGKYRLPNRIHLQQQISKWVGIFKIMTKRQIQILDKWGYEQIKDKHDAYAYFPLLELAEPLQEKGYF